MLKFANRVEWLRFMAGRCPLISRGVVLDSNKINQIANDMERTGNYKVAQPDWDPATVEELIHLEYAYEGTQFEYDPCASPIPNNNPLEFAF